MCRMPNLRKVVRQELPYFPRGTTRRPVKGGAVSALHVLVAEVETCARCVSALDEGFVEQARVMKRVPQQILLYHILHCTGEDKQQTQLL